MVLQIWISMNFDFEIHPFSEKHDRDGSFKISIYKSPRMHFTSVICIAFYFLTLNYN